MKPHELTIDDWKALPRSDALAYEEECRAATMDNFRDPSVGSRLHTIVENTPVDQVEQTIYPVRKMAPWMLKGRWARILQENDACGKPTVANVADTFLVISPTTARYARHIAQLLWLFGPVPNLRVAEIGGGYGGLCRLFMKFFPSVSYTLYDIPAALTLQERYLTKTGITDNIQYCSQLVPENYDLVIGVASLCELSRDVIDKFGEAVLCSSRRGYLAWSRGAEGLNSPSQIVGWLKGLGIPAVFSGDDFLFREVCTDPLFLPSVYYWESSNGK